LQFLGITFKQSKGDQIMKTNCFSNLFFIVTVAVSIIIASFPSDGLSAELSQADKDLFTAIDSNDMDGIKKALNGGANINAHINNIPVFIRTIIKNNSDAFQLLIDHGLNIDPASESGEIALHMIFDGIFYKYRDDIIEIFLQHIKAPSRKDYLHALETGDYTTVKKTVKEFLKLGYNIDYPIKSENYTTSIISDKLRKAWSQSDKIESQEITALYIAAREGHTDIVKFLFDHGSLINDPTTFIIHGEYPSDQGPDALMAAAANGHADVVKFFIGKGADINGFFTKPDSDVKEEYFGETPLMWAAVKGHTDIVKLLINKGADVNKLPKLYYKRSYKPSYFSIEKMKADNIVFDDKTITGPLNSHPALILAAMEGHTDIVRLLLNAGADVNIQDRYDNTALIKASENGHTDIVKLLLKADAKINTEDYKGCTALIFAAENGRTDVVQLLLEHDADTTVRKRVLDQRYTALETAAVNGYADIVELLFDKKNVINIGYAMMLAATEGHADVVKLLIAKGVDVNEAEKNNFALTNAIYAGQAEVVKLLMESGINNEKATERGLLLLKKAAPGSDIRLWNAVRTGNYQRTLEALKNGADVNAQIHKNTPSFGPSIKYQGRTPLSVASDLGYTEIVKLLIESGAAVNAQFPNGATALHFAVGNGHADIVKLLIEKGANTEARITQGFFRGMTPLMYANAAGHSHLYKILQNAGAKDSEELSAIINNFLEAAESGDIKTVKDALKKGIDVNASRQEGKYPGATALMFASGEGHADIVKYLIERGADVNEKVFFGMTALIQASFNGHADIVQILLKNGAKADEKISSGKMAGESALSFATYNNHPDVVQLLVQAGANPDDLPAVSPYLENKNKDATIKKMKELGYILFGSSEKSEITEVSRIMKIKNLPADSCHDAWNNPIMYQADGKSFTLTSYGRDGVPGGKNFDEDIVLSETSLVTGGSSQADSKTKHSPSSPVDQSEGISQPDSKTKQREAKQGLSAIARNQEAYFSQYDTYSKDLSDIDFNFTSKYYDFYIASADQTAYKAVAKSKAPGISGGGEGDDVWSMDQNLNLKKEQYAPKPQKKAEPSDNSIIKVSGIDLPSVFRRLENAGFSPGPYQKEDLSGLSEAVKRFQKFAKLDENGIIDSSTWAKLEMLYDPQASGTGGSDKRK